jgi:cytoskeleton protein RodZ
MSDPMNQVQTFSRPVLLRQAREAQGLHIAALAAALKVPVKKLEALEAGRYDELPDLTFARALASSACRQLKIDPAPVLEQIPQGQLPVLGDTSHAINAPFKAGQEGSSAPSADWLRRPAVAVSVALLVGAAVLLLVPDWDDSLGAAKKAVADLSDTATPAQGTQTPVATISPAPTPVVEAAPAVPGSIPVTPVESPPPAAPVDAASTPSSSALLRIAATADAWVEVVDGAGKSQVQRMLRRGDALDFSTSPPYSVVVGRADAVEVSVRGQSFDVMPYARNSVARFQVK